MARPNTFADKFALVEALSDLSNVSRYLTLHLVELGYVERRPVVTGKRGRPAYEYAVTGKGRGYIALSKKWKRAA